MYGCIDSFTVCSKLTGINLPPSRESASLPISKCMVTSYDGGIKSSNVAGNGGYPPLAGFWLADDGFSALNAVWTLALPSIFRCFNAYWSQQFPFLQFQAPQTQLQVGIRTLSPWWAPWWYFLVNRKAKLLWLRQPCWQRLLGWPARALSKLVWYYLWKEHNDCLGGQPELWANWYDIICEKIVDYDYAIGHTPAMKETMLEIRWNDKQRILVWTC